MATLALSPTSLPFLRRVTDDFADNSAAILASLPAQPPAFQVPDSARLRGHLAGPGLREQPDGATRLNPASRPSTDHKGAKPMA